MLNSTEIKSLIASGGSLFIGVDDNNVIQGVSFNKVKNSALQNSINEITPVLHCEFYTTQIDAKDIALRFLTLVV